MPPGGAVVGVPRGRPSTKLVLAGMLALVGAILAGASLAGPWWRVGWQEGVYYSSTTDFGLFGYADVWDSEWAGGGLYLGNYATRPNVEGVMLMAMVLAGGGIANGVAGASLALAGARRPDLRAGAVLFTLVGGLLGVVISTYLMTSLPGSVIDDFAAWYKFTWVSGFWGRANLAGATVTWGAGWAWYTEVVGSVLMFMSGVLGVASARVWPASSPG